MGDLSKTKAGRKPIRVIAAELNKKIDQLKSNQAEWEAFQARICGFDI
jgi:FKBP-type peptidyl-prolyl cis-trans isomerase (trigger factor)